MFYFGKGSDYYMNNYIFWTKIGLFGLVGLLSVIPTVRFLAWRKKIKQGDDFQFSDIEYKSTKSIILLELILFTFIPLMAVFMARGFGY